MGPSKNRINMHDIIAQPLGAVADAVNSVLRRPEKIDDGEVQSLFRETSFLLLRVEEALSIHNEEAGSALILLLLEGLTHSDESLQLGLTTFSVENELLSFLQSICKLVFQDGALPIQSPGAADIAQVVCTLSESEVLKEKCGELFFDDLVGVLSRLYENPSVANTHVQTQRSVTAALINLVKGSAKNKQRRTDWLFLLSCLTRTVDVFFQLQCIELLYRMSRKNHAIIANLMEEQEEWPSSTSSSNMGEILRYLDELPNDQNLLSHMLDAVQRINEGRSDVLSFSLLSVTAGGTVIGTSSLSFFTPYFFVVLLTSSNADNISVPYSTIRSVTISKDARVFFRLQEFPPSLEPFLHHTAPDMDSIVLSMTSSTLGELKASSVRRWIIELLQEKHRRGARHDTNKRSTKDLLDTETSSRSMVSEDLKEQEVKESKRVEDERANGCFADSREMNSNRKASMENSTEDLSLSTPFPSLSTPVSQGVSSVTAAIDNRKREREMNQDHRIPSLPSISGSPSRDLQFGLSSVASRIGEKGLKEELETCNASSFSPRTDGESADVPRAGTSEERERTGDGSDRESARRDAPLLSFLSRVTEKMTLRDQEGFFFQLEQLMAAKKARREEDNVAKLSNGIWMLQKLVDEYREKCQKKRDQWFSEFSVGMNQVDTEIKMVKEAASAAVSKLNEGLRQIKSSNQAVDERLACMQLRLDQVLQKSKMMESEGRATILAKCEEEVDHQESVFVELHQEQIKLHTPPVSDR